MRVVCALVVLVVAVAGCDSEGVTTSNSSENATTTVDERYLVGTPLTLPPGVTVPQDFERNLQGLADDAAAARQRFQRCMEDSGQPVGELDPAGEDIEVEKILELCRNLSGMSDSVGNEPAEVILLNEQAWNITECMSLEGWDWPDPALEPFGRYLVFAFGESLGDVVPEDAEGQAMLQEDLAGCLQLHKLDWSD